MPITRLVGKRKLSQNRPATDRIRVAEELANSERPADRSLASAMPKVEPS